MWTTGVDIVERRLCSVWNNALDMWEKYVGWMVTNKSGGRQAERDEGKERRWRMWAGWAQSFRTGSKNVLTLSQNLRRGGKHLYKEWNYESFQNPDLTVFECVWMRQWVKAVLLMRIWKSNHRLWLRRLGSAVLNDTLPLHRTKANLPKINRFEGRIQPWQRWDIQLADMLQTCLFSSPRVICVNFLCGWRDNSSLIFRALAMIYMGYINQQYFTHLVPACTCQYYHYFQVTQQSICFSGK